MYSVQWWQRLYSDPLPTAHNVREVGIPVPTHLHTHYANISGETTTSLRESCRHCLWITRLLRKLRHLWRRVHSGTYTHARLLGYNYAIA